jgi:hypothetical protein
LEKELDLALRDGPKEIIEMDEVQEIMIKKVREKKLKDDKINREIAA